MEAESRPCPAVCDKKFRSRKTLEGAWKARSTCHKNCVPSDDIKQPIGVGSTWMQSEDRKLDSNDANNPYPGAERGEIWRSNTHASHSNVKSHIARVDPVVGNNYAM